MESQPQDEEHQHTKQEKREDAPKTGHIFRWVRKREEALLAWEQAKPGREGRSVYRVYTALFIPVAILVFFGLIASGREIIWNIDGMGQYYPFFVYEGEWLRGIIGGLVSGQGLNVPLWEWCSGYGADVPTTFDVFFDPLNLFSVIAPGAASEWMFQALVFVRLYLAGMAFTFYCRMRGENKRGTLLGAFLYTFCGAGLVVVQWTSGLHAFILFPVVLAGAEKLLAGGKPWVFIVSLTLLVVVSYYFAYMVCILLVGYLALRVVMVLRPNLTVGGFFKWVLIFAGLVVLCLALAAFSLFPAVSTLFGLDRVTDQSSTTELLYDATYYINLLSSFISTVDIGSDTLQGFGGLAFFACVALFATRGENRELKFVFVVLTVFLLVPAVGSFFNGMNYATNRWAWAYALCVAFILTRMTPVLLTMGVRKKRILVIAALVYLLIMIFPTIRTEANMAGYAALLVALLAVVASTDRQRKYVLLTGALVLTLAVNGFYFLFAEEGGKANTQLVLGVGYKLLTTNSCDTLATETGDDSWWRYDAAQSTMSSVPPINRIRNNSLTLRVQGIDFYNSVYNNGVDRFHTELAVAGDNINFSYLNLQGRSDLMALLGVKYYAMRTDGTDAAPVLFSDADVAVERPVVNVNYQLLRANKSLPVGYVFDKAISYDEYLSLSPIQRQQALLQAVVLDNPTQPNAGTGASAVTTSDLSFESQELPFSIAATDGVVLNDGAFVVQRAGATMTIALEGIANAETYFYTSGLTYRSMNPSESLPAEERANMNLYKRIKTFFGDLFAPGIYEYEMAIKSDVSTMSGYIINSRPDSHIYGGKDTWLVNLGYAEGGAHTVTVTFNQPGEYSYSDMKVYAQTNTHLGEWVDRRASTTLENVTLGCNELRGTVDMDDAGTLFLSVANSPGWTAYVDGQPAEILRADSGFMALDLGQGHHDVQLRYFTPGLKPGLAVTAVALAVLIALIVGFRARSRRRRAT